LVTYASDAIRSPRSRAAYVQGRQEPPGAPHVELPDADVTGVEALDQQQRRDEEAGQDEEDIDAEKSAADRRRAAHAGRSQVVEHDRGDGERAHAIESGRVPETMLLRFRAPWWWHRGPPDEPGRDCRHGQNVT
jgi:hypothetical protein